MVRIRRGTVVGIVATVLPLVIAALVAKGFFPGAGERLITLFLINVIAVIGIGVYSGNSGIISFGNVGFMAVGAYASGLLTINPIVQKTALPHLPDWLMGWGMSFLPALLVALVVVALVAVAIGIPVARLGGSSASICTLGFLVIVHVVLVASSDFTRGSQTFFGIPRAVNIWIALPFAILAVAIARIYRDSASGMKLRASREDEIASTAVGVNVRLHRFLAWVLGAILSGVAGVLFAHFIGAFSPKDFYFNFTFMLLAMLILGGITTVSGAVLGSAMIMVIVELLRKLEGGVDLGFLSLPTVFGLTDIGIGLAILLVMYRLQDGLLGVREVDEQVPFLKRLAAGAAKPVVEQPAQTTAGETGTLRVENVGKRFSGLVALEKADFEIRPGLVTGLIGPNGAGKSTLINSVSGVVPPSTGRVMIDGTDVASLPVHRVPVTGLARTFQNIRLFKNLTVLENVTVAASAVAGERDPVDLAREALAEVGLGDVAGQLAGTLSYGAQRRLEIARALALKPRYLLLDEPAAGMNPAETQELMAVLDRIRTKHRLGLLVVEHDLKLIMRLCDVVVVLNKGQQIAIGTPAEIQANPAVIEAYIGRRRSAAQQTRPAIDATLPDLDPHAAGKPA
ncbi:branched-chain amino acid ABC transporter ATP-binding protein/permease [Shinella sp. CPCC 101442]|uniref:branched-chain amino acid ABC transporter ATP-binding protein/permease n=1 Tax=Shinella sp. CPCC 101442 TaxID=2932265 RepID=UPI0021529D0F|nr:branched-chain amino acid ABC transporter ATP-binding protein/permease [Shinella sp. CPCC 101442]MCR6498004.1 branched-chain amino acid ABC transporter ATP-binding protein/permease [Shinella sp. CPCC 101442]